MALGPSFRDAWRLIVSPVLQTTLECSWGTSAGNAEENAHSSSSLLAAGGAGACAGAGAGAGTGVVEPEEAPIKLAKGSVGGCGCCGGVNVDCAGWGVAELEAEGDVNEEKPGEGEGALAWLFCVTEESRAGPGMPEDGLEPPGESTKQVTYFDSLRSPERWNLPGRNSWVRGPRC